MGGLYDKLFGASESASFAPILESKTYAMDLTTQGVYNNSYRPELGSPPEPEMPEIKSSAFPSFRSLE